MTLETREDFNNPPIVYDAFGRANDSGSVVVDVLEGAYDPDGSAKDLEVVAVGGGDAATVVDGVEIRADRGEAPKVLPFEVTDADGATAVASVYIPPTGNGLPYVLGDALIELDSGATTTGKISDYVAAPDGAEVRLASGRRSYSSSPSALSVGPDGDSRFSLTSAADYRGPGALLVEVTTAQEASGNEDTSTTDDGATVLLSIPVQVGDDKPSLECPSTAVPISAGQDYALDIATFCKVYTPDPRDAAGLSYTAEWSQAIDGVEVGNAVGSVVPVTASDAATEGGEAVLTVRAGDSNTQEVSFRLAQAPSPRLSQIKVETLEAGESRTYDIASYLESGVADPDPRIVSVDNLGNPGVKASASGSKLTLTASRDTRGVEAKFRLVVSDVSSSDPPESRRAEGQIQFEVVGAPAAPGEPRPFPPKDQVNAVEMSWAPPADDGGAPILYYWVKEEKTGDRQKCDTNTCVFRNLKSGGTYSFRAQAVNRVGVSEFSGLSKTARADTQPGRVQNIEMAARGNGSITIKWDKPSTNTSRILDYTIIWVGGQATVPGDGSLQFTANGLNNNEKYVFQVKAQNKVGYSALRSSPELQPLGTPPPPAAPAVSDLEAGANQTNLRITWQPVLPEGPGPTRTRSPTTTASPPARSPVARSWWPSPAPTRGVPYDGLVYTYQVVAANQPVGEPGNRSTPSAGTSIEAVGRPATWGAFQAYATGNSQEAEIQYSVPDSRGTRQQGGDLGRWSRRQELQPADRRQRHPRPDTGQRAALRESSSSVCNENAPAGCTLSAQQNVQTYGRLDNALGSIQPVVNGRSIQWVISGTSNGDPVRVTYQVRNKETSSGTGVQIFRPTGPGAFTFTTAPVSTEKLRQGTGNLRDRATTMRPATAVRTQVPPACARRSRRLRP